MYLFKNEDNQRGMFSATVFGGGGLISLSFGLIQDWVMNLGSPFSEALIVFFASIFFLGLISWVFQYLKSTHDIQPWKMVLFYVVPILVISMSLSSYYISHAGSSEGDTFIPYAKLVRVHSQSFVNEEVRIDGKMFTKCSFHNVKFLWDGENYFMEDCSITGETRYRIRSRTAQLAFEMAQKFWGAKMDISKAAMVETPKTKMYSSTHGMVIILIAVVFGLLVYMFGFNQGKQGQSMPAGISKNV